jgi:hypothetical protein
MGHAASEKWFHRSFTIKESTHMQMRNVLIATAILWGLNALLIVPISSLLLKRRLVADGLGHLLSGELTTHDQERLKGLGTKYYIITDLTVLGTAGFIGGLLGYYFIGVAFAAKGWPGMIAFIAASFVGLGFSTNGAFPHF